jgi:hypothetical protein
VCCGFKIQAFQKIIVINMEKLTKIKTEVLEKDRRLRKLDDEEWKVIPGSNGKYYVSNYGRIKSFMKEPSGKILKFANLKGFYTTQLNLEGKIKTHLVHKITAEVWVPKSSEECTIVTHLDWNIRNNHYQNLEWITRDVHYMRLVQRQREQNKNRTQKVITYSKLKANDVKLIKSMLEKGVRQNLIAKMFCISEMQVTRIKRGENWGDVKSEPSAN